MRQELEELSKEFPNLQEFLDRRGDTYLLGLIAAHQIRRGRARNMTVAYGTPSPSNASYLAGANRDLVWAYNRQLVFKEAEQTADEIYGLLKELQLDATIYLNQLRDKNSGLTVDQKAEKLEKLQEIEGQITELTSLLERLSA